MFYLLTKTFIEIFFSEFRGARRLKGCGPYRQSVPARYTVDGMEHWFGEHDHLIPVLAIFGRLTLDFGESR